jgi:hypothetical protein
LTHPIEGVLRELLFSFRVFSIKANEEMALSISAHDIGIIPLAAIVYNHL